MEVNATPEQMPQKPKSNGLVGVLVVLVLLLLGATSFLAYQNSLLQTQIAGLTIAPTPYISPEPTVAVDATANWKTIQRVNWQFKVPTNWNYLECSNDLLFVGPLIDEDRVIECGFDGSPGLVSIGRTTGANKAIIPTNTGGSFDPVISEKKSITVGGRQAIWQRETVSDGHGIGDRIYVYVDNQSSMDIIILHNLQEISTFTQILSTFRFTEAQLNP